MIQRGIQNVGWRNARLKLRFQRLKQQSRLSDLPGSAQQQRPLSRRVSEPGIDLAKGGSSPRREIGRPPPAHHGLYWRRAAMRSL